VCYVSRWRAGLPPSTSQPSSAATSAAYSSGYCSNCSDLHDSKTPIRILDLQRRQRRRTCRADDVTRMTSSSNNSGTQQPSVKHELDSSIQVSSMCDRLRYLTCSACSSRSIKPPSWISG